MIRGNVFFEIEKIEQLALINRLTIHHDSRPSLKGSDDGIMIRQYPRGLFQQHRPMGDIQQCLSLIVERTVRPVWPARVRVKPSFSQSPAMATGATQPLSMPRASARSWTKYVARWLLPKTARDACKAQCPCKSDSP